MDIGYPKAEVAAPTEGYPMIAQLNLLVTLSNQIYSLKKWGW
jgi:hypothetical protein